VIRLPVHLLTNEQAALSEFLLAARVSLEHDVLINTHLLSHSGWTNMSRQRATLWRHVQRDGIPLTTKPLIETRAKTP